MSETQNIIGMTDLLDEVSRDLEDFRKKHASDYSVKNVTIDVTEAPLHEARVGPGLNNIDFLQFQSHYTSYNLFGGARRLDLDFTAGNLLASSLSRR